MHVGGTRPHPELFKLSKPYKGLPFVGWYNQCVGMGETLGWLTFSGVFERYPDLHVIMTEGYAGWLAFAIQFFADYYGIPYPGEKCDLVALPDFSFGAMENLGCVTFRETRLLLDPDAVTLDEMSGAALTIVHEIAHMWFGDLVIMKWWNGIWLNEAFATFMEHLGVDKYKPEWKTWDEFALGRAAALDVDALENTRTVEYEVVTPEDAASFYGAGYLAALQNRARAEFPDVAFTLVVDCGDAPGYALACLRAGVKTISMAEMNEKIADIARQMGAELVRRPT